MRANLRAALVLAATMAGVALTARLGWWQLSRAQEKLALQAALDTRGDMPPLTTAALAADALEASGQIHRRVRLRGHWDAARTIYLDNRPMNGRVGFYVLTPLRLEDRADAVVVQRGWMPRDFTDRTRLQALATPQGVVEVEGRITATPSRLLEFAHGPSGPIRQNLDLGAFAQESGLRLVPLSVLQTDSTGAAPDGLLRQWPAPAVDVHRHEGYAFQWFALATLMSGLYVWFQLLRPRFRGAR
jgi:surfeit locus 1 family protein